MAGFPPDSRSIPSISDDEVLLEYQAIGNSVKVTAIHPSSLVEVSIVGPANAERSVLARAAINKLRYRLARQRD
jgi:hypothetical protein